MFNYAVVSAAACIAAFLFLTGCGNSTQEYLTSSFNASEEAGDSATFSENAVSSAGRETFSVSSDVSGSSAVSRETVSGETQPEGKYIFVYVCGAVLRPGVYRLPQGARVCRAIEMAGGLTEDADRIHVNQAKLLEDGEQITILTEAEAESLPAAETAGGSAKAGGNGISQNGKVNINTADSQTLQTLTGIGESRAAAIIEYRETNGAFRAVEDIMKVAGIKTALFNNIKDKISVG